VKPKCRNPKRTVKGGEEGEKGVTNTESTKPLIKKCRGSKKLIGGNNIQVTRKQKSEGI